MFVLLNSILSLCVEMTRDETRPFVLDASSLQLVLGMGRNDLSHDWGISRYFHVRDKLQQSLMCECFVARNNIRPYPLYPLFNSPLQCNFFTYIIHCL